jgi:hypothetical protein
VIMFTGELLNQTAVSRRLSAPICKIKISIIYSFTVIFVLMSVEDMRRSASARRGGKRKTTGGLNKKISSNWNKKKED